MIRCRGDCGNGCPPPSSSVRASTALVSTAYIAIGGVLLWSRLAWLGKSFWYDEVLTMTAFVHGGPRRILSGFTRRARDHREAAAPVMAELPTRRSGLA